MLIDFFCFFYLKKQHLNRREKKSFVPIFSQTKFRVFKFLVADMAL